MNNRALQERLGVLFWLIEQGWLKFGNVPKTIEELKAVKRKSDGSFDLETVGPLVRALCLTVGEAATTVAKQIDRGVEMELPELDLPDPQRPRDSIYDFMSDLVKASNVVIRYLFMVAAATPLRPLSKRESAIFPGLMVRLAKLFDSLVGIIVMERGEIASILLRPVADTAILLEYLIQFGSPEMYEKYVKGSLAFEKRLWEEIEKRKQAPPQPIEVRIQESVRILIEKSGYTLESIAWEDRNWGDDAFERARKIGKLGLYEFMFRTFSHPVHGTWSDLLMHHVQSEGERYVPDIAYTRPGPQLIEGGAGICIDAALQYLDRVVGKPAAPMTERLHFLRKWFNEMARAHDQWQSDHAKSATAKG